MLDCLSSVLQALSVTLRRQTLDSAMRNVGKLKAAVDKCKATDEQRLKAEYQRLVGGLQVQEACHTTIAQCNMYLSFMWERGCFKFMVTVQNGFLVKVSYCHMTALSTGNVGERGTATRQAYTRRRGLACQSCPARGHLARSSAFSITNVFSRKYDHVCQSRHCHYLLETHHVQNALTCSLKSTLHSHCLLEGV